MSFRYRALLQAIRSLRGETHVARVRPTHSSVPYRMHTQRGIAPLADIYLPAQPHGASVLLVHGGGFVIGSRRMKPMRYLAAQLVANDIAVCAVDYRMIFRGGRLDEAVEDVCDALQFWWTRAREHGLDPDRIAMLGLSAGASLALLAANRTEPSRLARLACCFGMYEVEHLRGPAELLPRLLFATADRAAWHERCPRHAAQPTTPTLLLHGDDDGLIPVEHARRLAAHRESLGLPTKLVIYPGAPHGFFNSPTHAAEAAVREIVDHVTGAA
jgi:acetyl esterase/lipase